MRGTTRKKQAVVAESWIEKMSPFEGPEDTLFLFSRGEGMWYVLGVEGSEARVPARDLLWLVNRCLAARRSD